MCTILSLFLHRLKQDRISFGLFNFVFVTQAVNDEDVGGLHEGGEEGLGHLCLPLVDEVHQGGEGKGVNVGQVDRWLVRQLWQEVPERTILIDLRFNFSML